jgi:hypothetical protein
VEHAYGPAVEISALIEAIRSPDPAARRAAYDELAQLMVHQGNPSPACPVVVPFLVDVVADEALPDRFAACQILRMVAVGDQELWFDVWPDQAEQRREVARQARLSRAEREREQQEWVNAAPTEKRPQSRAFETDMFDVDLTLSMRRTAMDSYDAVRAAVPSVLPVLRARESAVRLHAAALLAWFPEERDVIVPALVRLIEEDDDFAVVAVACVAAGLCVRHADDRH